MLWKPMLEQEKVQFSELGFCQTEDCFLVGFLIILELLQYPKSSTLVKAALWFWGSLIKYPRHKIRNSWVTTYLFTYFPM